jgi:hypothetical protein
VDDLGEIEQYYIERTLQQEREYQVGVARSQEELLKSDAERLVLITGEPGQCCQMISV